jgi:hypothetical protein
MRTARSLSRIILSCWIIKMHRICLGTLHNINHRSAIGAGAGAASKTVAAATVVDDIKQWLCDTQIHLDLYFTSKNFPWNTCKNLKQCVGPPTWSLLIGLAKLSQATPSRHNFFKCHVSLLSLWKKNENRTLWLLTPNYKFFVWFRKKKHGK